LEANLSIGFYGRVFFWRGAFAVADGRFARGFAGFLAWGGLLETGGDLGAVFS